MSKQNYLKKIIEVSLPLDIINEASSKEKSIRQGHPVTLHQWWARRPLAAASAVLFASIIDDPSNYLSEKEATKERKRLFKILSDHIQWSNYSNQAVIKRTRAEIIKAVGENPPPVYDPFSGGGSIPMEAQRLGIEAYSSDLNPVAVLISKTLVEILPRFKNYTPINESPKLHKATSSTVNAFYEDFSFYADYISRKAYDKLENLYPTSKDGKTVIAWLWARTVKCPNPACGGVTPLLRSYILQKQSKTNVWIEPSIDRKKLQVSFHFHNDSHKPPSPLKIGRGANFNCVFCGLPINDRHIKKEGKAKRLDYLLIGGVVEGSHGQEYIDASLLSVPRVADLGDLGNLETELNFDPRAIWVPQYGLERYCDLFTDRQLKTLLVLADLVKGIKKKIIADGLSKGITDDGKDLTSGGTKLTAYAEALATFLAFVVDRCTNYWSTLTPWGGGFIVQTFNRQGLAMAWDFAEANPFSDSTGSYSSAVRYISKVIENCPCDVKGHVEQLDAASANLVSNAIICTDPPYYDNIGYADYSDYFYVWLRRMLSDTYPTLFSTLLVPKKQEIVASPNRFDGDKDEAKKHFSSSLGKAFQLIKSNMNPDYPFTLFYAFKQMEKSKDSSDTAQFSTGWETMLQSLIESGFQITGTWPMRTERPSGMKNEKNALASSVVIVCRLRALDASLGTRREFISELRKELPPALKNLQAGAIAPVDMAQAAIGPGMSVFTKFSKVLEADGSNMSIRTALQIINQELDTYFSEQASEVDKETRFCVSWFAQFGWKNGPFGIAESLMKAHNTAINSLEAAGIVVAKAGKVRLLKREELADDWDPTTDKKLTVWECVQYIIRTLEAEGEEGAAEILRKIGGLSESVKELAYRLYALCDKKGWAEDGLAFNNLISSWQPISDKAQFGVKVSELTKKSLKDKEQKKLFDS